MQTRYISNRETVFEDHRFDIGCLEQNDRSVAKWKWVTDRAVYSIDVVCLTALEHLRLYAEKGADRGVGLVVKCMRPDQKKSGVAGDHGIGRSG